jgi:NAD+ kinase
MNVLLYLKKYNNDNWKYLKICITELQKKKITSIFLKDSYKQIRHKIKPNIITKTIAKINAKTKIDFLICFGGDGTMLSAANLIKNQKTPIIGVNTGRLGFLANVAKNNIKNLVSDLHNQNFTINKRSLINIRIEPKLKNVKNYFALNELAICGEENAIINIKAYLNNNYLNNYWGDGLIISTPTGSTGYSLSCGGPIIMPDTNNFIITPIASHNLNVRPLIISDKNKLKLELDKRFNTFTLSIDGIPYNLTNQHTIFIKKSTSKINFLITKENDYLSTLRNKLLWGLDKRNS